MAEVKVKWDDVTTKNKRECSESDKKVDVTFEITPLRHLIIL